MICLSPSAVATRQIFNLSAGNYSVIVNDSSNCPTQLNISMSEPSVLELNAMIINESCEGYLDGEIQVSVWEGHQIIHTYGVMDQITQ